MEYRILNIKGALLDIHQLEDYLRKIASGHLLKDKSDKNTYPIPRLNENFKFITEVYKLLNEHIKLKLPIHPAGEWILDNFYIIDETVKMVTKELTLKNMLIFRYGKWAICRFCKDICISIRNSCIYRWKNK